MQWQRTFARTRGGRNETHNHYKVDKRVLAQAKVTAFMLDAIVEIEAGTYRVYSGKPEKDNPAYYRDAKSVDRN